MIFIYYLPQSDAKKETNSKEESLAKPNNSKSVLEIAYDTLSNCDTLSTLTVLSRSVVQREVPSEVTVPPSACETNSIEDTGSPRSEQTKLDTTKLDTSEKAPTSPNESRLDTSIEEKVTAIVKQFEDGIQEAGLGMKLLGHAHFPASLTSNNADEGKKKETTEAIESDAVLPSDSNNTGEPEPPRSSSESTEEFDSQLSGRSESSKENLLNVPSLLPDLSAENRSDDDDSQDLILQAAVWIEEERIDGPTEEKQMGPENLTNHVIMSVDEAIEVREQFPSDPAVKVVPSSKNESAPVSAASKPKSSLALRAARMAKLRRNKTKPSHNFIAQDVRSESPTIQLNATQAEI